jgi:glucose-1-phosphate cytidylyltransferase
MKVVILAGGFGTRISEETHLIPKPLIEIGDKPIIWHIMKIYSSYGFNDFIICLGYKGREIKNYFANYYLLQNDFTIDFSNDFKVTKHENNVEPWKITLIDTGLNTMTGGRVKRIKEFIGKNTFMLTYGDGLSNVNINDLIHYHNQHGKLATVTAAQPQGRFGALNITNNNEVVSFREKPKGDGAWVNGGYFVLEPEIFDLIDDDQTVLEQKPLEDLAKKNQLMAFKHNDFWYPMDTLRDKNYLNGLWDSGQAPWKVW